MIRVLVGLLLIIRIGRFFDHVVQHLQEFVVRKTDDRRLQLGVGGIHLQLELQPVVVHHFLQSDVFAES